METSCGTLGNGFVLTNNNDTIRGMINILPDVGRYSPIFDDCVYFTSGSSTDSTTFFVKNRNGKVFIKTNDIKSLNFVDKKNKVTSTYIFNIYFWKLLITKDNLSVYIRYYIGDARTEMNWNLNEYEKNYYKYEAIAIFSDKILKVQIYSGYQLTMYNHQDTKQLLQFINTRYNLSLTQNELLSYIELRKPPQKQTKLFDFILDKEAELEKMQVRE